MYRPFSTIIKETKKRTGEIIPFNPERIYNAITAGFSAVGIDSPATVQKITQMVVAGLEAKHLGGEPIEIETIQDEVTRQLVLDRQAEVTVAYIQYRKDREGMRNAQYLINATVDKVRAFVDQTDWEAGSENSNVSRSVQALNNYLSEEQVKAFWLETVYTKEFANEHKKGTLHGHDLGFLGNYCAGHDLKALLTEGFGIPGAVTAGPAKHLRAALGQAANFLFTLQGESAGAQAFSNFDTYLAPFIHYNQLSYPEVKAAIEGFIFNMNVKTRVGFQTPFTNITLDLTVPKNMAKEAVIWGGQMQEETYGQFQNEMDMLNKAFCEVMTEGDYNGSIFAYPIPTYNVTKEWDWDHDRIKGVFEMASKYGIPYFSNFISSDMDPDDSRSMCCRLRLDNKELRKRGGGLFGANPLTGSIGVVTLNMPMAAYETKSVEGLKQRVAELVDLAAESLELKRKELEKLFTQGMYPYSAQTLRDVQARTGQYLSNHFSTVGLVGMHEALLNLGLEDGIACDEGRQIAVDVLDVMRDKMTQWQEHTGNLFNLEATPAESTCYRLALKSRAAYPDIITSGKDEPYFTNSSNLPVDHTSDLYDALMHQNKLQTKYTGGTVHHAFIGESIDWKAGMNMVKKAFENFEIPYLSLSPTFSICPVHGFIHGKQSQCECGEATRVFSRVTGFYTDEANRNPGKKEETEARRMYEPVVMLPEDRKEEREEDHQTMSA